MGKKNNIVFGILFFLIFFSYGIYVFILTDIIKIWTFALSLIFLIVTIINPNLLNFLNKLWIQFGFLLGKIISPIIMALLFYFLITPIGILLRIFKKDPMGLKRGESSYYINRKEKVQSMKRQF